jgi:hypothetical protein
MKAMETRSDELVQRAHATDWWTRCAIRDTLCARAVAYRHADPALATLLTGCAALIVATSDAPRAVDRIGRAPLLLMPAEPQRFTGLLVSIESTHTLETAVLIADSERQVAHDSARRWWTAFLHTLGAALIILETATGQGEYL